MNKRLGKPDKQYGAVRLAYNVSFVYEDAGKNEVATSMTWEPAEGKAAETRKLHGKYVLLDINSKPLGKRKSMLHPNRIP